MKTKKKVTLQRLQTCSNSQLSFVKTLKLSLIILSILITACSKEDDAVVPDAVVPENCPEITLTIKEDTNENAKITVQATSSIITELVYAWKVTDEKGIHEVAGNTDGSLPWKARKGETKFCVTIKTSDCNEDVEECITYNLSCEDKIENIASKPLTMFSKPVFKEGYMYYAQQKVNFGNISQLAVYKLNLSDENATPINIIDVKDNVFGEVHDLVFKDDVLYVSVSNHILHSKVYKIDTSIANPQLVEALDLKFKTFITGMMVKGNDMYSVSGIKSGFFKMDLTKSNLVLEELTTIGESAPFEARSWTGDMVFKGNELYISARSRDNGNHIVKIDLNDPNLKQTIVISNMMDPISRIELQGDDLYFLFDKMDNNNDWVGNWIGKLNITESTPTLERVVEDYGFRVHDFSFYKEFMYISTLEISQNKYELTRVPLCSL